MNIIFVIKDREINLDAIKLGLDNSCYKNELTVIFACEKKNPLVSELESSKEWSVPAYVMTYPQGTTADEMLDNTLRALEPADTVIIRDECENYTSVRLDMLIDEGRAGGDVVMLRQKRKNKRVRRWFRHALSKLCGRLFGFEFYDGDIGMMYFSKPYTEMLARFNSVLMTKLNRFVLTDVRYINAEIEDTKISGRKLKRPIMYAAAYFAACAAVVIASVVVNIFVTIPVVIWVLIMLLFASLLILLLHSLLNLYIAITVGVLTRHRVDYVRFAQVNDATSLQVNSSARSESE